MIFCEISIQDQEKNSISQHLKRSFQILCVILHLLVDSLATESDFNYYIDHLQQPSYNAYDLIYLCFHGQKKCICFADKTDLALMAFAEKEENLGIFEGRNVHFGSCSTLKMREEDIKTMGKRYDTGICQPAGSNGLCGEEAAWVACILCGIRFRL